MAKSFGGALREELPAVLSGCKDCKNHKPHIFYKPGQEKEILDLMIKLGIVDVTYYPIPVITPKRQ